MSRSLTAGASAHLLIDKLERAGWGNLAGPDFRGVRTTLAALTRMLDPRSGDGRATVWQISERTGYTTRWTARCLRVLEELELIEWHRGGVVDGQSVPSWFRVSKRALLILIQIARNVAAEALRAHREEVRQRIAHYRLVRTSRGRKRRSTHVEVSSPLLFIKEVPAPQEGPAPTPEPEKELDRDYVAALIASTRARIRAARGTRPGSGQGNPAATSTRALGSQDGPQAEGGEH